MKKIILLMFMIAYLAWPSQAGNHDPVKILAADSGILYLKFSRLIQGGTIQIVDEDAIVVFKKPIHEHKLMIDFHYLHPGKYTITISKEDFVQTFSYTSAEPENEKNL